MRLKTAWNKDINIIKKLLLNGEYAGFLKYYGISEKLFEGEKVFFKNYEKRLDFVLQLCDDRIEIKMKSQIKREVWNGEEKSKKI